MNSTQFFEKGWIVFPPEPCVSTWVETAHSEALHALEDPALAHWYHCERTWFVGLDALSNDAEGRLPGGPALSGTVVTFIKNHCGGWPVLHRAQISGIFPDYPKPRAGETAAGFRYRLNRDAAHVDGILGKGEPKRRFVEEPHAFILGLPLSQAEAGAAPLVVWEGSHKIMQDALRDAFERAGTDNLSAIDVTDVYQDTRRCIFETCRRVAVHGPPGTAILVHRLALHGVAPWADKASAAPEGRLIAYFRPAMPGGLRAWVDMP